jgi:hypothetical protein
MLLSGGCRRTRHPLCGTLPASSFVFVRFVVLVLRGVEQTGVIRRQKSGLNGGARRSYQSARHASEGRGELCILIANDNQTSYRFIDRMKERSIMQVEVAASLLDSYWLGQEPWRSFLLALHLKAMFDSDFIALIARCSTASCGFQIAEMLRSHLLFLRYAAGKGLHLLEQVV